MIEAYDYITCDNGKTYHIVPNWKDNGYDFMMCLQEGQSVNEVKSWHINDCFKFKIPICVGLKYKTFEYSMIEAVYDIRGNYKFSKAG
ncbi:hypothetical protein [Paenibacillus medicaginis]|uniref:Uncharacterized protein n=1 Tax=Paenibacillus medicaginis TaxID=1470560 RepID=A0ABV5BY51_9BACL